MGQHRVRKQTNYKQKGRAMKRLILAALVSAAALVAPAAQAQTFTTGQFNVAITLNSTCALSAITDVSFTYTSNQGAVANSAPGGGSFSVTCTTGLPYTFHLQEGTTPPVPPFAALPLNVTDALLNLDYQLNIVPGGANGTGAAQAYNITGTMAANQSGTCGGATCTNATSANRIHTLIVDF
jgi:spore coat protein U-like protein